MLCLPTNSNRLLIKSGSFMLLYAITIDNVRMESKRKTSFATNRSTERIEKSENHNGKHFARSKVVFWGCQRCLQVWFHASRAAAIVNPEPCCAAVKLAFYNSPKLRSKRMMEMTIATTETISAKSVCLRRLRRDSYSARSSTESSTVVESSKFQSEKIRYLVGISSWSWM